MSRIILLSPPYIDLYGKIGEAAGRYFPLGLGYIASYLRKYGQHEVRIHEPEAQRLSLQDIAGIIKAASPDVIGLTSATPNFPRAIELARKCRESSQAKIVLGGVHASAIPEFILEAYPGLFDCIVVGEGERTMLELVDAYGGGSPLSGIRGIVFKEGADIVRTEARPFIEDMDSIPYPARDLIPQHLFYPNMHNARYRNAVTILTSRGCPFNCSFCASRIVSGRRYRTHSAGYVLDEMEMLKRDYGARQLLITDDTFTMDRRRLEEICRGMIDRRLNLRWFCFSQVNTVDREALTMMKRAGCYSIGFGVESAEPAILRRMGKSIRPEQAIETVRLANRLGFKTQAFYIFGSPGETRGQMENTIRFSGAVDSTLAFFNMLVPYPGTRDFDHFFSGTPLSAIRWEDFVAVGENCVLSKNAQLSKEDIERLIARANVLYYLRPWRLLRILFHIRTLHELSNYISGGFGFLRQVLRWGGR